jgi:hypothetical protein
MARACGRHRLAQAQRLASARSWAAASRTKGRLRRFLRAQCLESASWQPYRLKRAAAIRARVAPRPTRQTASALAGQGRCGPNAARRCPSRTPAAPRFGTLSPRSLIIAKHRLRPLAAAARHAASRAPHEARNHILRRRARADGVYFAAGLAIATPVAMK